MARWKKDTRPDEVAVRINTATKKPDSAGALFIGFDHSEFAIVLGGMIEFSAEIPEIEQRRMLGKAIFETATKGTATAELLLRSCTRQESEYLKKPVETMRLLTGISLASSLQPTPVRTGSYSVSFNPRASKAASQRAGLYDSAKNTLGFDLQIHFMPVAVSVKGRSPFEVAQRALDAIDLHRAIWNLALNRGKGWRHSSGRPSPVNDIRLSPFHTLHHPDGSLATETWWYDTGFTGKVSLFADRTKFHSLMTFSNKLRKRLRQSFYAAELSSALVRYVRALDATDFNDAYLRLWSLLEYLTDSKADSYKSTIRRAAFMFVDRDYSLQVLNHLASHRNRFVHAGVDTDEIESLVFLLKRYVEALLMFHIGNSYRFESLATASQFMDLPTSKGRITERIRLLQLARSFVSAP